ncbi:MAG: hypothetical protein IJ705_04835 [Oscillospiraceae bacterium]|nr:hypothetical protein [Oscillospiraceae bacterium]
MEEKLKALFDFQRFAQEDALAALIRETEARYGAAGPVPLPLPLPDDWLEGVAAAGDPAHSAGTHSKKPSTDTKWKGDQHK